jgi:hypothetical protein
VVVSLSPGIVIPGEGISVELKSSKYVLSKKIITIAQAESEAIITFADSTAVKKKRLITVLGFSVFDGQGTCWGKVKAQPQYSFNQLLEVEDEPTGEIFYVPWHESIIKKIDRRAKTIWIDPPQGLRDLNR